MSEEAEVAVEVEVEATPEVQDSMVGADGKYTPAYLQTLPESMGEHSIFEKYDNPVDMFKGVINAQALAGKKAEDFWTSEDEDVITQRKAIMGVPKDVGGYEYSTEGLPEALTVVGQERADSFRDFAFEKGYPKQMVEDILEFDKQGAIEQFEKQTGASGEVVANAETELRKEWKGAAFDDNIERINKTLVHLGLEDWASDPAFGNSPARMKQFFDVLVPLVSNDTIVEGRQSHNISTTGDELNEIEAKMNAEKNVHSPQYKAWGARRLALLTSMN